ncbi:MAG: hypothetical protein RLW62_14710 [Gammaproteobacteria bacterium]
MKTITAIAIIAATTGSAHADSFAPWNSARVAVRADAEQAVVTVRSFYRADVASGRDAAGEPAAEVTIEPWYTNGRV